MSAPGPPAEPTPPGSPTLIAEPDGEIPLLEGTGLASSWADLEDAVAEEQPDGLTIAFAAAGAGLDTLGAVTDPRSTARRVRRTALHRLRHRHTSRAA